ncbi:MAG: hypothetical protein H3C34_07840 [Caldilineaceae bacterium]|nr:hypothetical protein [Caldilineaceae bacterium]
MMGEPYYRICHYDQMSPFFMSLVSSSDHWLFISSTGGLTAGRQDANSSLFPYETDDKIAAHSEETGAKVLIQMHAGGKRRLWEPFSCRYAGLYRCQRNLYKNKVGNKIIFEEINHDLQLVYRYAWRTSDRFGFVKSSWLHNLGSDRCEITLLDGLQNLLPYGATQQLQTSFSNLLNAYKHNELEAATGLGIFALSATLTDRAEPSESLKATVAWQLGLEPAGYFLCSDQLESFRHGREIAAEREVLGKAGAYFVHSHFALAPAETRHWHIVADVNQDSAAIVRLRRLLQQTPAALDTQLEEDIEQGTVKLIHYIAAADGLEHSADETVSTRQCANVLFNIMRGGVFADGYWVGREDLLDFVRTRNREVLTAHARWFDVLPAQITVYELYARAASTDSPDLIRLCYEYLPLIFSRRHGDPSRPWNRFAIKLRRPDGSPQLDYQGNWRDIFQNWEPLALSFPAYVDGLIAKFLNATTVDGYNPYRVTRAGIEWEIPEPDNPWANIGYWSDHQIIYLQKLLEIAEQVQPGVLASLRRRKIFAYAGVPYRLRSYQEMLADWYNTIDFDWQREEATEAAVAVLGTDGRLRRDPSGRVVHANLDEKLLVLLLAKLTNLVPEGGIWMNTQRPEWNDANNALVGKGLSVVTAAYLRRFIAFWLAQLDESQPSVVEVNAVLAALFERVHNVFVDHAASLEKGFTGSIRRAVMDALGEAATIYRAAVYQPAWPAAQVEFSGDQLRRFLALSLRYIDQTLRANRRPDGLYHAYNILHLTAGEAALEHLYPMLEGQVAILSSGLLDPAEAHGLLTSMRQSDLYRADQHTYMLYPNRRLPGFLQKNHIIAEQVASSSLVSALTVAGDRRLLIRDDGGDYHFNGTFRNVDDVMGMLEELAQEPAYAPLVATERDTILDLFEATFNHRTFTGRSGTFFAFEGLGSIYWHMVSKLLLAVQECHAAAVAGETEPAVIDGLASAYYDIRQGLGFNKSPAEYGAFPTDPYSHTPMGGGARQPGMTGQVKEEILTRRGELGVVVEKGCVHFEPRLLRAREFLREPAGFNYVDAQGHLQTIYLAAGSLAFTLCQTPVIYYLGERTSVRVTLADGHTVTFDGPQLDRATTQRLFARDGFLQQVEVNVAANELFEAARQNRTDG